MDYHFMRTLVLSVLALGVVTHYAHSNNVGTQNTIQKTHINAVKNKRIPLSQAVNDAIKFSPKIKSIQSAVKALGGTVEQAQYQHNPEIGFNINNIAGHGSYQGINTSEYDMLISQTIERGNKHEARIYAAMAAVETTKIDILTSRQDIKYATELLYLDAVIAHENIRLAHTQEDMAHQTLSFITKRVAMAAEHETQRSKANLLYQQAISNRKIAERKLIQAKEKIAMICGYQNTGFDVFEDSFLNFGKLPKHNEYNTENIQNIPDLQKFDFIKKEKQAVLALEKANAVLDPKVTAGIRHFVTSSDQAFIVGISMPIAIYDTNQGNINRAYAEIEQVEHDRKQAELTTKQMLISAYQDLETIYMQLNDIKIKLIPQAQRSFELAKTAYKNDILSYIEVLDAQNTLFETKQNYIQLLQQYQSAKITISRLTKTV